MRSWLVSQRVRGRASIRAMGDSDGVQKWEDASRQTGALGSLGAGFDAD